MLILVALAMVISTNASASNLSGKVTDVIDGATITLLSLNKSIRVRLLGVAPPEKKQRYAEVARKHLSDLVLGKYVVVRYTGLGQDGCLMAKVLLEQADINAQMLRDGVAWYYAVDDRDLSQVDREVYQESEKAARGERRGLWQDASPVAPWIFVREQLAGRNSLVGNSRESEARSDPRRGDSKSLTSDDLFGAVLGSSASSGGSFPKLTGGIQSGWKTLTPDGQHFSVLVPAGGVQCTTVKSALDGTTRGEGNFCVGKRGDVSYVVVWSKGPMDGPYAMGQPNSTGGLFSGMKGITLQRTLKSGDVTEWQYDLSGPAGSGSVHAFLKGSGSEQMLYVISAANGAQGDPEVAQFLSSFKINNN